jgi:hypothetical protein
VIDELERNNFERMKAINLQVVIIETTGANGSWEGKYD